jgi:effector-binding domain-containing protein
LTLILREGRWFAQKEARLQNLVPIGRFSKICRLTIPALRLYDELDLLRPALVDPDSGYRYYSLSQAPDAERIRRLREIDMPLDEIRAVLAAADPAQVRDRLEAHRSRLQERAEQCRQSLASLERIIEQEARPMEYEVKVRETVAQPIVSIRTTIPMAEMPEFFGRAYGEMFSLLGELGIRPAGVPFTMYHDQEFTVERVDMEVVVPISEPAHDRGRVKAGTLPGGRVAYALHQGPFDEIAGAYRALADWVQSHGHELAGPPRECYLVSPNETRNPAEYRTEIVWPIK